MAGIGVSLEIDGLAQLNILLDRLTRVNSHSLVDKLGNLIGKQTVDRLVDGKRSPDGDIWPEWSSAYAISRHTNQSLLQSSGHLIDSIQHIAYLDEAEIGTNLIYASIHQLGSTRRRTPQREFLGISSENLIELQSELDNWAEEILT